MKNDRIRSLRMSLRCCMYIYIIVEEVKNCKMDLLKMYMALLLDLRFVQSSSDNN